ncbi:MAG: hypothetical protein ACYS8X_15035 [Planctomycetota bacterium]|jgi:aminomethyltransferase
MTDPLHTTALHDAHVKAGAQLTTCDGWLLPEHFGDVEAELTAVRTRAGAIDSSHLGRIRIRGDGALDLLERALTADAAHQEDDTAVLTALCRDNGSLIDVGFLLRLETFWVLTTNAAARPTVLEHLQTLGEPLGAKVDDQTFKTSMITVAGPMAAEILDPVLPVKASELARGEARSGSFMIARYIAMRTGSTGLWSLQVMLPNMLVGQAWRYLTQKLDAGPIQPVGVAACDELRRAANIASHADLVSATTPITAALPHTINFNHPFLGRDALQALGDSNA